MTTPLSPQGRGLPLRLLAAGGLLALAGVIVLFGFLSWIIPASRTDLPDRFGVDSFTNLAVLAAPLLALLVAAKVGPVLPQARQVGLVALGEYATALVLGTLAFLITIASHFQDLDGGIYAVGGAVQGVGTILETLVRLGLLALAALWAYRIFTGIGGRLPQLHVQSD